MDEQPMAYCRKDMSLQHPVGACPYDYHPEGGSGMEPREPGKLCGRRLELHAADGGEYQEPDYAYCGREFPHGPPHMAMVWWFDDDAPQAGDVPPPRELAGHPGGVFEHTGMGVCNKGRRHEGPCDFGNGV